METKQCNKCGQIKPIDSFRKRMSRNGIDYWYQGKCKDCIHIEQKEYFKEKMSNPEYANKRKQDNKKAVIKYYSDDQNRIKKNNRENIRYANKPKSCKIYVKECPITHQLFIARKKSAIYSNEGMRLKINKYKQNQYNDRKEYEWEIRSFIRYKKCDVCGKEYDSMYTGTGHCCSIECSSIALRNKKKRCKQKRRAREKNAIIERIDAYKVFERDKWRCKICGVKTPKKLFKNTFAPDSPTLDHIVPLAKGGSHTYSNVQCLCRMCNSSKSDKLIGQLNICV